MHGRLKVKTSAEQQEEKRKEREKKLELFIKGCTAVNEKRIKKEYDKEALTLIGGLLQANPDYYTLWNFRKEILLHLKNSGSVEETTALCTEEMSLTEACLRKNVKSYGAWFHRLWTLKLNPDPNWSLEIRLCNRLLEIDERNFHCWNHRRSVCDLSKAVPAEELSFTMRKIEANISNYSAWHYRSSLLPLVHPGDKEEFRSIDEKTLLAEYEIVQNAYFTDPWDQSAWFYHRWLLGRAEKCLGFLYAYASLSQKTFVVAFTKPILLKPDLKLELQKPDLKLELQKPDLKLELQKPDLKLELQIDKKEINCHWENPLKSEYASSVWVCRGLPSLVKKSSKFSIKLSSGEISHALEFSCQEDDLKLEDALKWKDDNRKTLYSSDLSSATQRVLKNELESCEELMKMEPENKWTILTHTLLMQALDSQKHWKAVSDQLNKLSELDPMRGNYYFDLRSKFLVENSIDKLSENDRSLGLAKMSLTRVTHLDHLAMIKELDLSHNWIASLKEFGFLVCLRTLLLDDNRICDLSGLEGLAYLNHLSVKNNFLSTDANFSSLEKCPKIEKVNLEGNPVCENIESLTKIRLALITVLVISAVVTPENS